MKNKEYLKENKFKIFFCAIIILFVLAYSLWDVFIKTPWYGYTHGFDEVLEGMSIKYEKRQGDLIATASLPSVLRENGWVRIQWGENKTIIGSDGNAIVSDKPELIMFIYPETFGETRYVMHVDYDTGNNSSYGEASLLEITENPDGTYNISGEYKDEKITELFNEYKYIIEDMLQFADENFSFGGMESVKYGFKYR